MHLHGFFVTNAVYKNVAVYQHIELVHLCFRVDNTNMNYYSSVDTPKKNTSFLYCNTTL